MKDLVFFPMVQSNYNCNAIDLFFILFLCGLHVFWNVNRSVYSLPRMRLANWISFGVIVTRRAWMAHKFVSSNRPTAKHSAASCEKRQREKTIEIFFCYFHFTLFSCNFYKKNYLKKMKAVKKSYVLPVKHL